MISSIGAFTLGLGILLSIVNFLRSRQSGALAGSDPWGADTLEWSIPSPPPAYATLHIPTVVSRHPLWDDHDEEDDPGGHRLLDIGRVTLASSPLDADLVALARMPEDTMMPVLLSLAMTLVFSTLLFQLLWLTLAGVIACAIVTAAWLWPKGHPEEAR
jgi:hypothetical protein